MVNSRDINMLREDVAVNCRTLIELCAERNLPVLITGTYRDQEYQKWCYMNGTAATPVLGPHGYGLAFDFCKNIKGHEYDDPAFFESVARIAKSMGFSWGGDWQSFPDRPHLEWLGDPAVPRNQVGHGKVVNKMPEFREAYPKPEPIPDWAKEAYDWAIKAGLTDGNYPMEPVPLIRLLTILYRFKEMR